MKQKDKREATRKLGLVLGFCTAMVLVPITFAADESDSEDRKLSVADYFDMESIRDPQISPDGKRIAYIRSWSDIMTDRNYSNLWLIDFDGDNNRPLTTGKTSASSPRWSPDGTRIAYTSSDSDDKRQLFVMWLDTRQVAKITNAIKSPSSPVWSPDGQRIAFNRLVPGKQEGTVTMPPKPEGAKWADKPTVIDRLVYRFDGRGYLPVGFQQVFTVPAEGGTERQITSGDYDHSGPQWLSDDSIVFSGIRKPDTEWVTGDTEIYVVNVESREIAPLTTRSGPDSQPVVSPDGKRIAYTGFDEKRYSYTLTRLYSMEADGSDPTLMSEDFDNDVRSVRWTKNGKSVLFLAGTKGDRHLYRATDRGVEALTDGTLQITSYTISSDDRVAAVISTPDKPGDLYSFKLSNPDPKQLTRVNEDVLDYRDLASIEEIWYKSSFDDRDVQGWILKPSDFDPEKEYPLILYIHGGPHGMYGVSFSFEFQMLAAQGYVVLYTNPRGSTGYGHEFGNLIDKAYPGDDYFDLMSGVDDVIKRGYIDEEQLYITGGSGGGVLTCWLVGRTDRFRAGVSQYPVINWDSWIGTADIGYGVGWRWFEKWPWEDPEHYHERSPISLVGNVTTPLLLITGENDWRTPISETEQYYRALKIQKIDSVMVRVPNEAHGVRARPSHYIAKMLHILEWFQKYGKEEDSSGDE